MASVAPRAVANDNELLLEVETEQCCANVHRANLQPIDDDKYDSSFTCMATPAIASRLARTLAPRISRREHTSKRLVQISIYLLDETR
jgi:hypothetical protein